MRPEPEREAVRVPIEQTEGRQQRCPAHLGQPRRQVAGDELPRASSVRTGDQVYAHGQRLPGEQEEKPVVGADGDRDGEHEHAPERSQPATGRQLGVSERDRTTGQPGQREEDAREPVGAQGAVTEAEPAAEVQRQRGGGERAIEADDHEQQASGRRAQRRQASRAGREQRRQRQGGHGQCEHHRHALGPSLSSPTASSSPCMIAMGAGGEPGT